MEINNPPQSEHTQKLSNPSALPIPHTPPDTIHEGYIAQDMEKKGMIAERCESIVRFVQTINYSEN